MKNVFIFLAIITPLICVASYLIVLLERRNKQVKSLMIENETLKHDLPSRIVDTCRIRVRDESSFNGYCSKETLEGKRCKDICDKSHCGY